MGLEAYLASREQAEQLLIKAEVLAILPTVTALRRRAQATFDQAHEAQAAEGDRGLATAMEEEVQTLGALVRELEAAAAGLRKAAAIGDQLDDVEERLTGTLASAHKPA